MRPFAISSALLALAALGLASPLGNTYLPPQTNAFSSYNAAASSSASSYAAAPVAIGGHYATAAPVRYSNGYAPSSYRHHAIDAPSPQYLAPAAQSRSFSSSGSGYNSGYATAPAASLTRYNVVPVSAPSRQYLGRATTLGSFSTSGATSYSAPTTSYSGHLSSASFAAPSRQYLAPAASHTSSYSAPAVPLSSYSAPAVPRRSYSAPAVSHTSYSTPSATSYSAPTRYASSSHGEGFGSLSTASSGSARSQRLGYGYTAPATFGGGYAHGGASSALGTRYAANGGYDYRYKY